MFHVPHRYRIRSGPVASDDRFENNGAFNVPMGTRYISVIASDGSGWEHVSVSFPDRCPTWEEMCKVKALFWDAEDCVMQLHPPESEYVSHHPYCLHLWRPTDTTIPRPPMWTVGMRATGSRLSRHTARKHKRT